MKAPRRISPPSMSAIRAPRRSSRAPTCRNPICARTRWRRSATSWRSPIRRQQQGLQPAGFELFDISVPENPRSITFFDCSGPNSRGVHQLWFADGEYIHMSSGAPDFEPTHPKDDQFYRIIDVKNPTKPVEVGRWWLPGTRQGDSEPPPVRHPEGADTGFRPHNTNVYPERPDRAYLGYIDGGHGHPRHLRQGAAQDGVALGLPSALSRLYPYGRPVLRPQPVDRQRRMRAHRGRRLAQAGLDRRRPHRGTTRCRSRPARCRRSRPTCGAAPATARTISTKTCRSRMRGNPTASSSAPISTAACAPTTPQTPTSRPRSVISCRQRPERAPSGAIQINDVFVDERQIVYTVDRHVGGLYTLEMDF